MFQSFGQIHYFSNPEPIILSTDPEITRYYRSQIPKYIFHRPQRHLPHVSISRNENVIFILIGANMNHKK